MKRALLVVMALLSSACSPGELSTSELLHRLAAAGVTVADASQERGTLQAAFDDLNDAIATNVPVPKLVKTVRLNGIPADVLWCPGGEEQARRVVAYRLGGPRPGDPPHLDMAAEVVSGGLDLVAQRHIVSLSPGLEDDEEALRVALALAKIVD